MTHITIELAKLEQVLEALEFCKDLSLSMKEIERTEEAITAIKQARSAPAVKGWKLVPVNPTPEMLAAADQGDREYTLRNFGDVQTVMQGPEDHYVAMLAAAPEQPAPVQPVAREELTNSQIMASVGRCSAGISESRPLRQQWDQVCDLIRYVMRERGYTTPPAAQPAPVQPVAQSLKDAVFTVIEGFNIPHDVRKILESAYYNAPPAQPAPVQPVAWVLLREDEDGFEPIQFYGGKEKPETAAGELKPRFTLRPVCFADTTPPAAQRQWVGLTDEEVLEAAGIDGADTWLFETAYAIEAKLKEKNT